MVKLTEKQIMNSYQEYIINCNRSEIISSYEDYRKLMLEKGGVKNENIQSIL